MKPDGGQTETDDVALSLLLASSVHDIKNSLGLLLNTLETEIAQTPPRDDAQRLRFATLQGEAARINHALISLLGLYRLRHNPLPVRIAQVFVADFLEEQISASQLLFDTRRLQVALECEQELVGYFDAALIAGVIDNVLVNAAHYARRQIQVRASQQNEELVLEVFDDGPGFPQKMLRAPIDSERGIDFGSGSTNLGLYFAAQIAARHRRGEQRGRIEVCNPAAGGGCFRLWLP